MLSALRHRAYQRAVTHRLSDCKSDCVLPPGGKLEKILHRALFALMGRVSKSDGFVSSAEVKYATSVMRILGLSPRQRQEAIDYFELGKLPETNMLNLVNELAFSVGRGSELARLFMQVLLRLVFTKGNMRLKEKRLLRQVAGVLGYNKTAFSAMCAEYQAGRQRYYGPAAQCCSGFLNEAYNTVGLLPDAADADIRPAYLRQMTLYHPDKQMDPISANASREVHERATEIRAAYEEVCKSRNLRI